MARLTDGSVRTRLFEIWLPMIGGVLAVKAIGVSDAYFVGKLGEQPLASISFTFPIVMTLISLAIGLGAGASSLLSRAIGDGASRETQQDIVTGAVGMGVIVAVVLSVAGLIGIDAVLGLMGAADATQNDAAAFMRIWFSGTIFLIVPIAINGMLRATGDGVSPALLMAGIAIVNIVLNPLFIFGAGSFAGLGMQGAAVATVLARAVETSVAIGIILKRDMLKLSLRRLVAGLGHWREVARVGLPASLSTSLNPVAVGIVTAAVATLGDNQVAAFGVASKIQSFALVPLLALSGAAPPLVGQNSGAGEIERSRLALKWCAAIAVLWAAFIAVPLWLGSEFLVSLFSDSGEINQNVRTYLAIVPLSFAGYGITVAVSAAMNGLGRSGTALAVGGGRALLLFAPAASAGVWLAGFPGLAVGVAAANAVAGIIGLLIIQRHSLTTRTDRQNSEPDLSQCE